MKLRMVGPWFIGVFLAGVFCANAFAATYTVSKIEDFISFDSTLYEDLIGGSLNDSGSIAGTYHPIYPSGYSFPKYSLQPFLWTATNGFQTLNSSPQTDGAFSEVSVNNNNQVVYNLNQGAFLYDSGTSQPLGTFNGKTIMGEDINDSGQVAGHQMSGNGPAVVWDSTNGYTALPGLPTSSNAQALAINNGGTAVGNSDVNNPSFLTTATSWDASGAHQIPVGPTTSTARAVNDQGQIAGDEYVAATNTRHAFLSDSGTVTDLGVLGGDAGKTYAVGVNDLTQVVGYGTDGTTSQQYAFLWDKSTGLQNLNSIINDPSWNINYVYDINNSSEILANGVYLGKSYSVLLTPVVTPEPASSLLFLFGAGSLALSARKRKFLQKSESN